MRFSTYLVCICETNVMIAMVMEYFKPSEAYCNESIAGLVIRILRTSCLKRLYDIWRWATVVGCIKDGKVGLAGRCF